MDRGTSAVETAVQNTVKDSALYGVLSRPLYRAPSRYVCSEVREAGGLTDTSGSADGPVGVVTVSQGVEGQDLHVVLLPGVWGLGRGGL